MFMKLTANSLIKFSVILLTMWVLVFGLYQFGVNMNMGGGMVNCPFSGHAMSICKMNPMEHLQEWQNMFLADPALGSILFLVLILASFLIISRFAKYLNQINLTNSYKKLLLYFQSEPIINILQEAFSNGILNPKTY